MKPTKLTLEQELDQLQREAFDYFLQEANPANGLILDKTAENWPASIAATGMALAAYPVGVERGYMSRALAVERTLTTLRFFSTSQQGPEPDATGYKGFYYHFLDMKTGRRVWQCELSTVDSAFLVAGMLVAGRYFDAKNAQEEEIRNLSDTLYCRMDWQWVRNNTHVISMGWKPEQGFLPYYWNGYDEALLLYIMALGSPTFPLPADSFSAWTQSYEWKTIYGYDYLYTGALFTHQFSHLWIDFRKIQDAYMREKNSDYFENSRRATYAQQQYAIHNPLDFVGYNKHCWGITASDGPGPIILQINGVERRFYDYIARSIPYGPDDGTIAPWAAITSLPFADEIVLPVIEYYTYNLKLTEGRCKEGRCYGFTGTFNQTFHVKTNCCGYWISPWHYGINQGPTVLMTENYRTGLLWELMKGCKYIVNGLKRAGFSGGWLNNLPPE
jgi:hypothetical protein